jgi:hypothetical protein
MFGHSLPTPEAADALAAELQAEGQLIASVDGSTVVSVGSRQQLEEGLDGKWDELAAKHGGEWDGWGTYVGPADLLRTDEG